MKHKIKAGEQILNLSSQGVRKFMRENPNVMIYTVNVFMNNMPVKLHNDIAEQNSKIQSP